MKHKIISLTFLVLALAATATTVGCRAGVEVDPPPSSSRNR